jgi:RNA polymerase sigma factor (sigma-70 family)
MSAEDTFPHLLARVRDGNDDAAAVIFRRFVDQLASHAHRHLSPAVRRRTDVVQSVYRTFSRLVREEQFELDHGGKPVGALDAD